MCLILEKQVATQSWGNSLQRVESRSLPSVTQRASLRSLPNNAAGQHNVCALTSVPVRKVTKNVTPGRMQQRCYRKYPQNGDGPSDSILCFLQLHELPSGMKTTVWGLYKHGCNRWALSLPGRFYWKLSNSYFFYQIFSLLLNVCIKRRLSGKPGFHQFSLSIIERIHVSNQYILLFIDLLSHFLLVSSGLI